MHGRERAQSAPGKRRRSQEPEAAGERARLLRRLRTSGERLRRLNEKLALADTAVTCWREELGKWYWKDLYPEWSLTSPRSEKNAGAPTTTARDPIAAAGAERTEPAGGLLEAPMRNNNA